MFIGHLDMILYQVHVLVYCRFKYLSRWKAAFHTHRPASLIDSDISVLTDLCHCALSPSQNLNSRRDCWVRVCDCRSLAVVVPDFSQNSSTSLYLHQKYMRDPLDV